MSTFAWCLLALAGCHAAAQTASDPAAPAQAAGAPRAGMPADPVADRSAADLPPQHGEQVHTGVSSGLSAAARLDLLLADHQFPRIEAELDRMPPDQARFYRGVLANRRNDPKTSIALLEPLEEKMAAEGTAAQQTLLRKTLAEDYLRLGDWARASLAYRNLEAHAGGSMTAAERDELELPVKLLPLAAANPQMTVDPYDAFGLPVNRNLLGLLDIPVFVDARPHNWMLEPTAPFNLIARSLAKEAGLTVSDAAATVHTLTGRPMQVHMTVIPRFTIGGAITFHDVTAFVFEDADYAFKETHYQVQGVLGYPAIAAMGSLTIKDNATIEVRPKETGEKDETTYRGEPGAPFFFDGDQMIVAMEKPGGERMFALDASGQQTYLTSRYYEEHASEFSGLKMEMFTLPGAPGAPAQPAYMAETVTLALGPAALSVHFIPVLTQPVGDAALDDVYGVLGLDALDQLQSYTFDFKTMTLSARNRE